LPPATRAARATRPAYWTSGVVAPASSGYAAGVTRPRGASRTLPGQDGTNSGLSVSVVLPCLNEAASVALCVQEALSALEGAGLSGEVLVVDNGSSDNSAEVASIAGARVVRESRRGYGSALLAGFRAATGDVIVMADADFTYNLRKIPELVAPIARDEADLVLASRLDAATRHTMPWLHRCVGTPVLTFLSGRACGRRVVTDSQSGFRAFRKDEVLELDLRSTGMELASEMLIRGARSGLRITEVETGYRPRIGESKLATFSDGWRHLKLILLLAPDLVLIGPGATLVVLGLVLSVISFLSPSGIDFGSVRWQPVFFAGIALVLGVQSLFAGAVLAHYSSVTSPGVQQRFRFVDHTKFANWCVVLGALTATTGLFIDCALFLIWLDEKSRPRSFSAASLAQSLILVGSTIASFGVVSRFQRARAARHLDRRDAAVRFSERAAVKDPHEGVNRR
jgi:Glycosyl transferase family 2